MTERPLVAYEPNPVLAWLYDRFFANIEVDHAWSTAVREADARGTVVYVLRNLSVVDFLALDYFTKRLGLPQVRFANDLGLWVLEPMGRGWLQALKPRTEASDAEDLRRAILQGSSAALFLKRPPTLIGGGSSLARGKREGDVFIRKLFEIQRETARPILLVPQVFVWSKHPDRARHTPFDALLGPREWPGNIRTVAQFLMNYRHVTLRAGEPVNVRTFLENEDALSPSPDGHADDDALVRRMVYALLRRVERERRVVVGPTKKPADRLREEVIRSPKLQRIIQDMAGEGESERTVLTWRALAMVRELEASLDMNAIDAMDRVFEPFINRMYSAVEVDEPGLSRLREAAKEGPLVYLPSHKSHVDYIILSYLLYRHHMPIPLIAAGDNLRFFPIGTIFRRGGAFFIRRSFRGDRLYGAVVDAYVRRLIKDGAALEFFLEGGRSRTGKLLSPKMGLLSIVVDAALGAPGQRVHFCPVSIGYERVVEEKSLVHEASGGEKSKETVRGLLSSAELALGRYGRLSVQFGEPLTLEQILRELDPGASATDLASLSPPRRRALVTRLGHRVMNEINRVAAVTPGALVAAALLTNRRRGLPHPELVRTCERMARTLHGFGARFSPSLAGIAPGSIRVDAIRESCELFLRAGHVEATRPGSPRNGAGRGRIPAGGDVIYIVPDEARLSLDLSKNLVVHFFVSRALVATSMLASPSAPALAHGGGSIPPPPAGASTAGPLPSVELDVLRNRVRWLSRLFKYEFQFRADAPFERIFEETLAEMKDELVVQDGNVRISGDDGREQIVLYAELVKSFVEGYRVAARGLSLLTRGALPQRELLKRTLTMGDRMFLAGEVARREALSRPIVENAHGAFVDQGYLTRRDGKLVLPESYASATAARTVEARIASFL